MKPIKKLSLMIVCSFIFALPLNVDHQNTVSMNGCAMDIYPQMSYFYEEKKDSIEVLLLGDSNIYRGFSPMVYWQDTGVTSYSFASASQPAWLSYYILEDALHYQKPKIVVFEINELFAASRGKTPRYCSAINSMHSPSARLQAIHDPISGFREEDRFILYRKFVKDIYQTTLKKMIPTKENKTKHEGNFKGYLLNQDVFSYKGGNSYMSRYDMTLQIDQENASYIDRILALCKRKQITVLFVKLPTKEWTSQKKNLARAYAKKRGIPLLDLNMEMKNLDWLKDTKDAGFHMNDAGAIKVTKRLEDFIAAYGNVTQTKDNEVIASYNTSLKRYQRKRQQETKGDIK